MPDASISERLEWRRRWMVIGDGVQDRLIMQTSRYASRTVKLNEDLVGVMTRWSDRNVYSRRTLPDHGGNDDEADGLTVNSWSQSIS